MPEFLEAKLRQQARKKGFSGERADKYVYSGMNDMGVMHGSKETAKGREMERKHEADMKKGTAVEPMREMRIEIHRDAPAKNKSLGPAAPGKVTGFTVHHHMIPRPTSKSEAFMENTEHSHPFGADQHEEMMDHIHEHTSAQLHGAAKAAAVAPEAVDGEEAEA